MMPKNSEAFREAQHAQDTGPPISEACRSARASTGAAPDYAQTLRDEVAAVVARQREVGLDVINEGE